MQKGKILAAIILLGQVSMSGTSYAAGEGRTHEFIGGSNSVFTFSGGNTSIGFALGYKYLVLPDAGVQVGYDTSFQYLTANSVSTTSWYNTFNVRYNFGADDIISRLFVDAGIGFALTSGSNTNSTTEILYEFGVGKRFQLASNVAYTPRFAITKVNNQNVRFSITVLAISVFF